MQTYVYKAPPPRPDSRFTKKVCFPPRQDLCSCLVGDRPALSAHCVFFSFAAPLASRFHAGLPALWIKQASASE